MAATVIPWRMGSTSEHRCNSSQSSWEEEVVDIRDQWVVEMSAAEEIREEWRGNDFDIAFVVGEVVQMDLTTTIDLVDLSVK